MDSKSGKSWLFGLGRGPAGHDRVFAVGANAKMLASWALAGILSRSRAAKWKCWLISLGNLVNDSSDRTAYSPSTVDTDRYCQRLCDPAGCLRPYRAGLDPSQLVDRTFLGHLRYLRLQLSHACLLLRRGAIPQRKSGAARTSKVRGRQV